MSFLPQGIHEKNTVTGYEFLLPKFAAAFPERDLESLSSEEVLGFLTKLSDGRKKATKRTRFASLTAFFNSIKNSYESDLKNPCDSPQLRELFRAPNQVRWDFMGKETVDEIIFKIHVPRDCQRPVDLVLRSAE